MNTTVNVSEVLKARIAQGSEGSDLEEGLESVKNPYH